MKQVSLFLISFLTVISVHAQQSTSTVTITVTGNKNLQFTIDRTDYTRTNSNTIGNKTTITINNLSIGQHTFQVTRTNLNTNRPDEISSTFNLRYRFDMQINVNSNGSLELIETRKSGIAEGQTPISNTNFNTLLKSVKNQRTNTGRKAVITNAFTKTNNYFTTYQVRQLIQLINSESDRLQLMKQSYPVITDPGKFNELHDLLKSQASRNELEDFIHNYMEDTNTGTAMSDASFNSLYQDIKNQWPISTQMNSLINTFNNTNNYFTTYQASQLIQLVSTESNRLQLAKLSYRSITDRNNFSQIYYLLISQSGKNELENYVNSYNEDNNPNIAMSDASFNSLYQDIKNQRPVSTQMNSLTNTFNNTNNYFSSYQVSRLIQLVSAESNRLQLAKLSYRSITDRNNFNQVYNLLSYQSSKDELMVYVNNYNNDNGNINDAMSDVNFNTLYQDIKNQWPVSTQMNSLTSAFNNTANYFTSYQASQLIQLVSNESNRLQLAKLSYRSITDRNNFSQIYNLLSYQSSKEELTAYVNNYNSDGNNANVAMPDANFNALYQDIKNQWPVSTQMNSLTSAFNNTNNYFSSYQASRLIQLVSAESNRLQLAKSSYRSITDRNNFNQVYNLLSYQSSKDELMVYVNNYNDNGNINDAMSDVNFNTLYQDIKNQWPVSTQMNSLTSAFNNTNNFFTSYQASQLIQLVSAESNRLQLAKLSYRSINDRNNFNQISNLLSYQSSKDELTAYVNNYNNSGGSNINVAMSDANYNTLYQTIQMQFFPGERMNSLTIAFNNTSNFFTSAQAKKLIQLVTLEGNKLQLAKLSYRTITDRNNFSQLYEVLDSQASKDELETYVKNYRD